LGSAIHQQNGCKKKGKISCLNSFNKRRFVPSRIVFLLRLDFFIK
jgi:hypothetical protein